MRSADIKLLSGTVYLHLKATRPSNQPQSLRLNKRQLSHKLFLYNWTHWHNIHRNGPAQDRIHINACRTPQLDVSKTKDFKIRCRMFGPTFWDSSTTLFYRKLFADNTLAAKDDSLKVGQQMIGNIPRHLLHTHAGSVDKKESSATKNGLKRWLQ